MDRPMIRFAFVASFVGLIALVGLAGCKQGVGDRCQVNSDCEDDLICVLPVGGTPQSGGRCESTGGVDMTAANDFAAPADLSGADLTGTD
jgi:hypothetical protein